MFNPYPKISEKDKKILKDLKLKPYVGRKIPDYANPNHNTYWKHNAVLFTLGLINRYKCT